MQGLHEKVHSLLEKTVWKGQNFSYLGCEGVRKAKGVTFDLVSKLCKIPSLKLESGVGGHLYTFQTEETA